MTTTEDVRTPPEWEQDCPSCEHPWGEHSSDGCVHGAEDVTARTCWCSTTGPAIAAVRSYRTTLDGDGPCQDCGGPNIVWFTDNVVWNQIRDEKDYILCLPCFIKRFEAKGLQPTAWRVTPEWPWRRA